MQRAWLFVLACFVTLSACAPVDSREAFQLRWWLRSLDKEAEVLRLVCKGSIEYPPGSNKWYEFEADETIKAADALDTANKLVTTWDELLRFFGEQLGPFWFRGQMVRELVSDTIIAGWVFKDEEVTNRELIKHLQAGDWRVDDVRCRVEPLKTPPPVYIPNCPKSIGGCPPEDAESPDYGGIDVTPVIPGGGGPGGDHL